MNPEEVRAAAIAAAVVQAEKMRAARAQRTPPAVQPATTAQVVAVLGAGRVSINVAGTTIPASIDRSLGAVQEGDTVTVSTSAGTWSVDKVITWHEPEPVLTAADLPPKPSVTVPAGPGHSAGNLSAFGLLATLAYPASNSNADLYTALRNVTLWAVGADQIFQNILNTDWRTLINQAAADAVQARNDIVSVAQQLDGLGDYAGAVGDAAGAAVGAAGDAAVAAGTAVRVQGISIAAQPESVDRAGYEDWTTATQQQLYSILTWRINTIVALREAANRGLAYKGLAQIPGFATPPTVSVVGASWSTGASNIQAIDDWCASSVLTLISSINTLRSSVSLGAGTYSTGTTSWSNVGSYPTSRASLVTAIMNYRIRMGELGTALMQAVNVINSAGTAVRVQGISITAQPDSIDRTGFEDWTTATQNQVYSILTWRVNTIVALREATNRGLAYKGLTQISAFPTPPAVTVVGSTWSAGATNIQAVDDWCAARVTTLISSINTLRSSVSLGAGTYSTGTTSWSNVGSYAGSRASLVTAIMNYRIRMSELGTAVMGAIKSINGS